MEIVSIQKFASVANESFDLDLGESTLQLTLIEVNPLPVHPFPGMMREPFALVFKSTSQLILPQKMYRLRNATVGAIDLFLIAIARDARGIVYQAVFN